MSTYTLLTSGRIVAGPGSIENLKEIAADFSAKNVIIISDKGVAGAGLLVRPQALLAEAGATVTPLASDWSLACRRMRSTLAPQHICSTASRYTSTPAFQATRKCVLGRACHT